MNGTAANGDATNGDAANGDASHPDASPLSFYDEVGGHDTFARLVDAFYRGVADDDVLRPMYPEEDLGPAKERLTLFLAQYWGGPTTYSVERGHPRLRMRHAPFHVNPDARDRWLMHMRTAVDELDLPPLHEATLWDYLQRAAYAMVNSFEPTGIGPAAGGRDATAGAAPPRPDAARSALPVTAIPPADNEQSR